MLKLTWSMDMLPRGHLDFFSNFPSTPRSKNEVWSTFHSSCTYITFCWTEFEFDRKWPVRLGTIIRNERLDFFFFFQKWRNLKWRKRDSNFRKCHKILGFESITQRNSTENDWYDRYHNMVGRTSEFFVYIHRSRDDFWNWQNAISTFKYVIKYAIWRIVHDRIWRKVQPRHYPNFIQTWPEHWKFLKELFLL